MHQKARSKWVREGDGNSRFFHAMVNGRRRKNFVRVLIMDRVWEDNLSRVKHEVNKFF